MLARLAATLLASSALEQGQHGQGDTTEMSARGAGGHHRAVSQGGRAHERIAGGAEQALINPDMCISKPWHVHNCNPPCLPPPYCLPACLPAPYYLPACLPACPLHTACLPACLPHTHHTHTPSPHTPCLPPCTPHSPTPTSMPALSPPAYLHAGLVAPG